MSVNVGQPEIPAGVAIGKFFVIEAEQVQQGRVQVVDVDLVLDGLETKLVGGAVDMARP